jgi:hypothetical protein
MASFGHNCHFFLSFNSFVLLKYFVLINGRYSTIKTFCLHTIEILYEH